MAKVAVTDAQLRETYPWIEWDEPVAVSLMGGPEGLLGCRLCIGRFGLKGSDVEKLYKTRDEWKAHMRQFHEAL